MEKSRTWRSVILPSLVGLVSGLAGAAIAVISSGYTERTKGLASAGVDSYVQIIERHFHKTEGGDPEGLQQLQARSSFTVFAKAHTLENFGQFRRCLGRYETISKCKDEWAVLIQSMRTDVGLEPGRKEDIIDSIWLPIK